MPAYYKISDAVRPAEERGLSLGRSVLIDECEESRLDEKTVFEKMKKQLLVMRQAVEDASQPEVRGPLYYGDAYKIKQGIEKGVIPNDMTARAVQKAIAVNGWNSLSGKVVATPTGGSCGILPGVLLAAQEEWGCSDDDVVYAMFAGAGMGIPIAYNGTLSGSVGGCQAECGSAAAMAAGALAYLLGGSDVQVMNAAALALKNSLGLACDPVAGLVEVPCVKRNGVFASLAITACDMALAGVTSVIPPDEVIDAMFQIGSVMPACLRETAEGGLAVTPTGIAARQRIFGVKE